LSAIPPILKGGEEKLESLERGEAGIRKAEDSTHNVSTECLWFVSAKKKVPKKVITPPKGCVISLNQKKEARSRGLARRPVWARVSNKPELDLLCGERGNEGGE